jgi:hypothetical protein
MKRTLLLTVLLVAAFGGGAVANATHSWAAYHWARTANPFTLKVGDNVSGPWEGILDTTVADWSQSTVLDLSKVAGSTTPRQCKAKAGQVEVCDANYGRNGWLGIAQIWISGGHITQGIVKLNDTYHNSAPYNTTAWRNLVSCQEVGHTLGLGHVDENFNNANLNTCMDYTADPSTNQHPNAHDFEELALIYAHLDSSTTVSPAPAAMTNGSFQERGDWGQEVGRTHDGRQSIHVREFGAGHRVITFVTWTLNSDR